jgi:ribosomal protein S18 acetylase RimI-like enzyme
MEVRRATISDICRIKELFWELDTDAIETQPEHFQRGERTFEYLSNIINDYKSDFLIAIIDNNIIGFSLLFEEEVKGLSLLVPCKYTYVQDFIITKVYRNHGYGTKLLEESKQWAKVHDSEYLRLSVIPQNINGIHFYKRNGMAEQMITMECPIYKNEHNL